MVSANEAMGSMADFLYTVGALQRVVQYVTLMEPLAQVTGLANGNYYASTLHKTS